MSKLKILRTTQIFSTKNFHTCGWCGEYMRAQSPAMYVVGVASGKLFSEHLHFECQEVFAKLRAKGEDVELNHDYFRGTEEPR